MPRAPSAPATDAIIVSPTIVVQRIAPPCSSVSKQQLLAIERLTPADLLDLAIELHARVAVERPALGPVNRIVSASNRGSDTGRCASLRASPASRPRKPHMATAFNEGGGPNSADGR